MTTTETKFNEFIQHMMNSGLPITELTAEFDEVISERIGELKAENAALKEMLQRQNMEIQKLKK